MGRAGDDGERCGKDRPDERGLRRRHRDGGVLIDGAGIPGTEAICRHGVAWCTHLAEA